jgi:hypothetical protein
MRITSFASSRFRYSRRGPEISASIRSLKNRLELDCDVLFAAIVHTNAALVLWPSAKGLKPNESKNSMITVETSLRLGIRLRSKDGIKNYGWRRKAARIIRDANRRSNCAARSAGGDVWNRIVVRFGAR